MPQPTTLSLPTGIAEGVRAHALRGDIQALRGWAVLVVVLYHAHFLPHGSAGYLGVDIFFVVSGYVITQLVAREIGAGTFTLAGFYVRRARRLLPAAYTTFAATLAAAPLFLLDAELRDFLKQLWGAVAFSGNIALWLQTGYFESDAQLKPLLHTWSLGIEEQFYAIWPLLLLAFPRKHWRAWALAGFVASLALCLALNRYKPGATFYLLPTRAWELALGCFGALLAPTMLAPLRFAFWPALLVLLLAPLHRFALPQPGMAELVACLATFVVLAQPRVRAFPAALEPLRRLGDISYSLYLVHWPVLCLAANAAVSPLPAGLRAALVALSLALAVAMYILVETPLRRLALTPAQAFSWSAGGAAALVAASLGVLASMPPAPNGAPIDPRAPNHGLSNLCEFETTFQPLAECRTGPAPRILLFGDSFAMHLADALAASGNAGIVQATKSMCAPLAGASVALPEGEYDAAWARSCLSFQESVLAWVVQQPTVDVVVLASPFDYLFGGEIVQSNASAAPAQPEAQRTAVLVAAIQATAARLRAMGKRVVLVEPPPKLAPFEIGRCLQLRAQGRATIGAPSPDCRIPRAEYERQSATLREMLARAGREAGIPVIRPASALCDASECRTQADGIALYRDAGHLSHAGSAWLGRKMHLSNTVLEVAR